jgi:ribulose-phosphate 3-epimerase
MTAHLTPAAPASADELLTGIRVAPSILSADYARLGAQLDEVLDAGARVIHFDVMDGHFVPPITFGPGVLAALSERLRDAGAVADVHLMIERPERQIEAFADSGAHVITIHCEATPDIRYALTAIRAMGCRPGLALNPGTPPELVAPVADMLDLALCMTVNPGWAGQRFIDATRAKIGRLRRLLPEECVIEVDGGIDAHSGPPCVALGANLLVAGSAIFGSPSPANAYRDIAAAVGAD